MGMDIVGLEDFCRRWLRAWTGNRPEDLRAFYSEGAFYRDPYLREGISGEALLPYFRKLLGANPDWVWEMVEVFPHSRGACLKWRARIPVGGESLVESGLDILEIENGLITRNEVYFDRTAWLRALGASDGN